MKNMYYVFHGITHEFMFEYSEVTSFDNRLNISNHRDVFIVNKWGSQTTYLLRVNKKKIIHLKKHNVPKKILLIVLLLP